MTTEIQNNKLYPINLGLLNSLSYDDLQTRSGEYLVAAKYIPAMDEAKEFSEEIIEDKDDSDHHVHRFYVEDDFGKCPVSYNFDQSELRAFPYQCRICELKREQKTEEPIYMLISKAFVCLMNGQNGLRSERIEIMNNKDTSAAEINNRLHHHFLCTQNHASFVKTARGFDPSEYKNSSSNKTNATVVPTKPSQEEQNLDPLVKEFKDFDPKYYPVLRVFKQHAVEHGGCLTLEQIQQYLGDCSAEVEESVGECVMWALLYEDNDGYRPCFSI